MMRQSRGICVQPPSYENLSHASLEDWAEEPDNFPYHVGASLVVQIDVSGTKNGKNIQQKLFASGHPRSY